MTISGKIREEHLDSVEFFALVFLNSELLALIVIFIAVVFSLNSLSSFSSLPLLWVLCRTHWDHYTLVKARCSFHNERAGTKHTQHLSPNILEHPSLFSLLVHRPPPFLCLLLPALYSFSFSLCLGKELGLKRAK